MARVRCCHVTSLAVLPMLMRPAELEAIRAGEVDLAFRRWDRPRLRIGTQMRTLIGLVEVTSVDKVVVAAITEEEARRAGAVTRAELLARLDNRADRPVFRVGLRFAGPDPRIALRERAEMSEEEAAVVRSKLRRLDGSARGPWTMEILDRIGESPGTRAAELAEALGRELQSFKRDVRKLKELGLTESLETGYRLSPRGLALTAGPTR